MRYLEKLMEGAEGVAPNAAKSPPAEVLSVVSHCLPSLYRYAYRLLGNKRMPKMLCRTHYWQLTST